MRKRDALWKIDAGRVFFPANKEKRLINISNNMINCRTKRIPIPVKEVEKNSNICDIPVNPKQNHYSM
jgi:hypothetical protein